ncbi:hypothetical protein MRB53_019773 [Persea americana]|uniref:Uncharacterized protein n=1 Tax=Persea americana TaxID=3435 RepID=A0ACC2KZZ5_PERAE|nr:hypothetical protein MRB53_019773 [Persea americana]
MKDCKNSLPSKGLRRKVFSRHLHVLFVDHPVNQRADYFFSAAISLLSSGLGLWVIRNWCVVSRSITEAD